VCLDIWKRAQLSARHVLTPALPVVVLPMFVPAVLQTLSVLTTQQHLLALVILVTMIMVEVLRASHVVQPVSPVPSFHSVFHVTPPYFVIGILLYYRAHATRDTLIMVLLHVPNVHPLAKRVQELQTVA
jgi:hypothetical protein